ncbi:hypothetical protein GOARA_022_00030 [Gordonia araii NBRC 100433]|uniref:Mce-associated membrane protein n=1 Tax=Gordonia araii NBRC 100433 TaxID=1073574 RepID=G7GZA2_9ACTN|nr:hypothetical protein [Gordonia araii]NNG98639.1 hypothetical protein [Gordonia araii NBRC 100433]GAB08927.1 hypothetical protein GOARA_022_00030 [Gordonia araii NBRC 100433]
MNRRVAALAALATVLMLVAVWGWWRATDSGPVEDPRRAAVMTAAAHATTVLMTQQPGDPPVRADVKSLLTGRLADEYASQGADVVLPGAVERRMTMTARVVGTGTAELRSTRARVLVFVDLWATPHAAEQQAPRVPLARWAAMRNVDGKWLLAGLTPVGGTFS